MKGIRKITLNLQVAEVFRLASLCRAPFFFQAETLNILFDQSDLRVQREKFIKQREVGKTRGMEASFSVRVHLREFLRSRH